MIRKILALASLVLAAMIGFLFSPRVPRGAENANCVSVTDVGPIHVHKNCDSEEFQYNAARPSRLLERNNLRQSRPLYSVLGWVFARPFRWMQLESKVRSILENAKQTYPKSAEPASYFPEYAAFVALNFILLMISLVIFLRMLNIERLFDPLTLLPLAMLIVNEVTKAFFWTPHMQMFNVLVPLASVALCRWLLGRNREPAWFECTLIGLGIGIASLAYGAFAAMAAAASLSLLVLAIRQRSSDARLALVGKSLVTAAGFFLPATLWVAFVKARTGSFYSLEISVNRDIVWLTDAIRSGAPAWMFWSVALHLNEYGRVLRVVIIFPVLVLLAVIAVLKSQGKLDEAINHHRIVVEAVVVFALPCIVLLWLVGLYYSRLMWSLVPPMTVLIAIGTREMARGLSDQRRNLFKLACVGATVGYVAYWYVTPGPWS
jgi:hypothetical protein